MTAVLVEDLPTRRVPRRRWPWLIVIVVASAASVATALVARVSSERRVLVPYPVAQASIPVAAGHTLYAGIGLEPDVMYDDSNNVVSAPALPVNVTSIVPRVPVNTSQAELRVLLCDRRDDSTGVGAVESDLSEYCAAVTPFVAGTTFELGMHSPDIILAVEPHVAGRLRVEGLDVTYSDGHRSTTEHAGMDIRFETR